MKGERFVAMLRGINVSGQKKVPMKQLQALFEQLKFSEVATYIQSGNVVFTSTSGKEEVVVHTIEQGISKAFGFDVPVILRTEKEMLAVMKGNPYLPAQKKNPDTLYVTFLAAPPPAEKKKLLQAVNYAPDTFTLKGRQIYLHLPNHYGTTKLNNNFFEGKLKQTATTRNWKTVQELVRLAGER